MHTTETMQVVYYRVLKVAGLLKIFSKSLQTEHLSSGQPYKSNLVFPRVRRFVLVIQP